MRYQKFKPMLNEVEKLLGQYREYLETQSKLDSLQGVRMAMAVRLGKEHGKKISEILSARDHYPEFAEIDRQEAAHKAELQNISDAMFFPTPVIWMAYKYLAYQGTSSAIVTMQDMKQHCAKPGYICTKRFNFLNSYLQKKGIDLIEVAQFPDVMKLPELYESTMMTELCADKVFMDGWSSCEFYKEGDRVAKWENFS